MKKYLFFVLLIAIEGMVSCNKSQDTVPDDNSYESVMVKADVTSQPCSGGYVFKDSVSIKYQTYDTLPGNPLISINWVSVKIKFHTVSGYHCPWVTTSRIIVDDITF